MVNDLISNEFDEKVLESDKTVIVDFWAPWCGPCKMLTPILYDVADKVEDAIIYKVNVDDAGDLAERFNITNVPTVIIFKDGEIKDTIIGVNQQSRYIDSVNAVAI